jgi:aminopeptidase
MNAIPGSELRTLAEKIVNKSLKVGKRPDGTFESVRIIYNPTDPTCFKMATLVEEECWRTGAYTVLIQQANSRSKLYYQTAPEDSLKKMNPLSKALVETIDVNIFIGENDDPNWSKEVVDKLKVDAPVRQQIRETIDNRKIRWLYFGWPLPRAARGYGVSVRRFRKIFFDSFKESFSDKMLKLCTYYHDSLLGHDIVEIKAVDGTDLSFRIKDRRILVDDGIISDEDRLNGDVGLNIPSGEVFVAPIEESANGKIYFGDVAVTGFGGVKGLWLTFDKGKIVDFTAKRGLENFVKFLDANSGEKDRIAELGIGCNPGAKYTNGSIIVDEKIYRTVHIAVGNNIGAYHGKNRASSHLDMIKFMDEGSLHVDGRLVMDKGQPAIPI